MNDAQTTPSEQEARDRLQEERHRLESVREGVGSDADEEASSPELSSIDQHPADSGTDVETRTETLAVLEQVVAELDEVEAAFGRLEDGTYGVCPVCGERIDPERLAVVPATRYCLRHERQSEGGSPLPPEGSTPSPSPI